MFDPVEIARKTKELVSRGNSRKYYRFRPSRFYGGIATADTVGCSLRCAFCWSWKVVHSPEKFGKFHSPEDVVRILTGIARKKKLKLLRISGNEPTISREHLCWVLAGIPKDYLFILETNGVLIGNDSLFAKELSQFSNLYVRVSLKGTCEEEFSSLTGSEPRGFELQLKAIENLLKYGVNVHPACMVSFSPPGNIEVLRKRLRKIETSLENFETEELILYPAVEERLNKLQLRYFSGYRPEKVPPEQV